MRCAECVFTLREITVCIEIREAMLIKCISHKDTNKCQGVSTVL